MRFLLAVFATVLYSLAVVILCLWIFFLSIIWLITPIPSWRRSLKQKISHVPSIWSETIRWTMSLMTSTKFTVTGLEKLNKNKSYLLISNHSSCLDILIMQRVLDRHVPQLRYFMKHELLYAPFLGQGCWMLGYPFMKRHSTSYLKKHPEKRNEDLETTRKACEHFEKVPVTLINYVEGTRFSEAKKQRQNSPFKHLLKPKAGGIAFIIAALEKQIDTIIDVTIVYPVGKNIMWDFLRGKMDKITVHVDTIPITPDLRGDYRHNREFRIHLQQWLNTVWQRKDQLLDKAS
ncbi:MAG: acyltransferase [Gammaproteobacteria bacterium]|nr:acyltransferase [Gammaproteobacteria bacterium]